MNAPESVSPEDRAQLGDDLEAVIDDLGLDHVDLAEIIWHKTSHGPQPILWPMVLHKHGQDCFRA